MVKTFLTFGDNAIEKRKFHGYKNSFFSKM